jgi:hypothetical protein
MSCIAAVTMNINPLIRFAVKDNQWDFFFGNVSDDTCCYLNQDPNKERYVVEFVKNSHIGWVSA